MRAREAGATTGLVDNMVNAPVTAAPARPRLCSPAIVRAGRRFFDDCSANIIVTFALVLPVLVVAAGAAIDYSRAAGARSRMQAVADDAALAAAQRLQLAQTDEDGAVTFTRSYVNAQLANATTNVTVDFRASTIEVRVQERYASVIGPLWSKAGIPLSVSATARLTTGALPLCRLRLDPAAPGTIRLAQNARSGAPGCVIRFAHPHPSLAR
jgi:Flp pilus assembly protein TadG